MTCEARYNQAHYFLPVMASGLIIYQQFPLNIPQQRLNVFTKSVLLKVASVIMLLMMLRLPASGRDC